MSLNYTEFHKKTEEIKNRLNACAETLERIKLEEKGKYEKPQYRLWLNNIKELENFVSQLEEWLNQPSVAEAKRYLSDIKKWSEQDQEISSKEEEILLGLKEIEEKEWKFLSDNVEEIKDIHKKIGDISYENIKNKNSTWVLIRVTEKDIETAKKWATNANKFTYALKQLENRNVELDLAKEVKRDSVDELLKITSFDNGNEDKIIQSQQLIDKSENVVQNKPEEIDEKAILETYRTKKKDTGIEENLSSISKKIEEIKKHLINLEWVKEIPNFNDYKYKPIWEEKQDAIKKNCLETISDALGNATQKANNWKEYKKKEVKNILLRTERMGKNVEIEELKTQFKSLKEQAASITWDKPDVEFLYKTADQINNLRKELRKELTEKLKNEDASSIIENPEIIEDLGLKVEWDFDRFFRALEVVLRKGICEIKMVEEK